MLKCTACYSKTAKKPKTAASLLVLVPAIYNPACNLNKQMQQHMNALCPLFTSGCMLLAQERAASLRVTMQPGQNTQPMHNIKQARGYERSDKQAAQTNPTHLSGRYIGGSPWGCCVRCIYSSRPPCCRGGERGQISLLGNNLGSRVGGRQLTLLNNHFLHSSAHCEQYDTTAVLTPKFRYTLCSLQTTQGAHSAACHCVAVCSNISLFNSS